MQTRLLMLLAAVAIGFVLWNTRGERLTSPDALVPVQVAREKNQLAEISAHADRARSEVGRLDAAEALVLSGVVLVDELDGSVTRDVTARINLTTRIGNWVNAHQAQVVNGHWSLRFVRNNDGTYTSLDGSSNPANLAEAEIDISWPALYDDFGEVHFDDTESRYSFGNEDVVIRLKRTNSLILRVEDARSRAPLKKVTLRTSGGSFWAQHAHPGDGVGANLLLEDVASPIRLTNEFREEHRGKSTILIGSPGYAWAAVPLNLATHGERLVLLERGGNLEVSFESAPPRTDSRLLLFQKGSEDEAARIHLPDGEPVSFEGLPSGEYDLKVESGFLFDTRHLTLATGTASVEADRNTRVKLAWNTLPELIRPPLVGTLTVPSEWNFERFTLALDLLDAPLADTEGRRSRAKHELRALSETHFEFRFGAVQAGKYRMSLREANYSVIFQLGPEGESNFALEVPPPVEIDVFLRDTVNLQLVDASGLYWHCTQPPGVLAPPPLYFGMTVEPGLATPVPDEMRFHFRVPRTQISISSVSTGTQNYDCEGATFFASKDGQFTIDVTPMCSAQIVLRDGELSLPWPNRLWNLGGHNGKGRLTGSSDGDSGLSLKTKTPGRYRIPIPKVHGYLPVEPLAIDFRHGETQEIEIQLIRLP